MSKIILQIFLFVFLVSSLQALQAQNDMRLYLDFARFRYDDQQTYLEIYYLLHNNQEDTQASERNIPLEFYLKDTRADTLLAKKAMNVVLDAGSNSDNSVKGSMIKTILPTGEYQIKLVRLSASGARIDSVKDNFKTTSFNGPKIKVSDLELCSNIVSGSRRKEALFYKNTMEVFPNPTGIYGLENPQIFYYVELYNVLREIAGYELEIQVAIKDNDGNIFDQKTYTRDRKYESLVEIGRFDISQYENGLYTLFFAAIDKKNEYSIFNFNTFYVLNKSASTLSASDPMTLFPSSDYFNMSEEEVDLRFAQSRYIATKKEIEIFTTLTSVETKRIFMFKFWYEREVDNPGLQAEFFGRVEYSNENFGFNNQEGWKSDKGRIYILYGNPSRITRRPNNPDVRPYEIWTYYEIEGGVKFLFIDETGFRNFRMVSSTLRGELYDPSWDAYFTLESED